MTGLVFFSMSPRLRSTSNISTSSESLLLTKLSEFSRRLGFCPLFHIQVGGSILSQVWRCCGDRLYRTSWRTGVVVVLSWPVDACQLTHIDCFKGIKPASKCPRGGSLLSAPRNGVETEQMPHTRDLEDGARFE
jgi:hypothetical protein